MLKNIMEHLSQVDTYGVISIVLFFTFFVGMLLWAWRLQKGYLNSMSALPLEDSQTPVTNPSEKDLRHE